LHQNIAVYIILFEALRMNAHDAFYHTVHNGPGGHEALAARMDMSAAVLRNKANPHSTSNIPSLRDVERVMDLTGDYSVLHALARQSGFVCVRVDQDIVASDAALLEIVTQVWTANGAVGASVYDALADGRIEPHEVAAVKAKVFDATRVLHELVARMEGMAEK
jgi:hypothetical protein